MQDINKDKVSESKEKISKIASYILQNFDIKTKRENHYKIKD